MSAVTVMDYTNAWLCHVLVSCVMRRWKRVEGRPESRSRRTSPDLTCEDWLTFRRSSRTTTMEAGSVQKRQRGIADDHVESISFRIHTLHKRARSWYRSNFIASPDAVQSTGRTPYGLELPF